MSEIINRAAMAVADLITEPGGIRDMNRCSAIAVTVIAAMHRPTSEMVAAVWDNDVLVEEYSVCRNVDDPEKDTAGEVWMEMIKAAMK